MNDLEQYQWDKPDMALMAHERIDIDQGEGHRSGKAQCEGRQGKFGRRCDHWFPPLSIPALTLARLNFLYS